MTCEICGTYSSGNDFCPGCLEALDEAATSGNIYVASQFSPDPAEFRNWYEHELGN